MSWNTPPPLLDLPDEAAYRAHYVRTFCCQEGQIGAHCGYTVCFFPEKFDDAFFESVSRRDRDKSRFSRSRAERMPWIRWTLENPSANYCEGWDRDGRIWNRRRLVAAITWLCGDLQMYYAVVIELMRGTQARFITAYEPDPGNYAAMLAGRI